MALSQSQWFSKLKRWVPRWFWQVEDNQKALFQGAAKAISQVQTDADTLLVETFILTADGQFLNAHGAERSIARLTGESDGAYRPRVQRLGNSSNLTDIKAMLDSLIDSGTRYRLIEQPLDLPFLNREEFCNRKAILCHTKYNEFTIAIEPQTTNKYTAIVEAMDRLKALGVFYRLIEVPIP